MTRIVKEYDERLNELLEAARQLFFEKGYDKTSVNHIIEKVGVAKGTFYHYFKSKEDLLDRLVDGFNRETCGEIEALAGRQDLGALEKLSLFFSTIRTIKLENKELMNTLMGFMYAEENLRFKHKVDKYYLEVMVPPLTQIIGQGKDQGVFVPPDPETAAELIMCMAMRFGHITVDLFLRAQKEPRLMDVLEKKLKTYVNVVERILGIEENTLDVIDRRDIEAFK